MYQQLFNLISMNLSLTQSDIALCEDYFEPIVVQKNTILEENSKIPKYLYFVAEGFVRLLH